MFFCWWFWYVWFTRRRERWRRERRRGGRGRRKVRGLGSWFLRRKRGKRGKRGEGGKRIRKRGKEMITVSARDDIRSDGDIARLANIIRDIRTRNRSDGGGVVAVVGQYVIVSHITWLCFAILCWWSCFDSYYIFIISHFIISLFLLFYCFRVVPCFSIPSAFLFVPLAAIRCSRYLW